MKSRLWIFLLAIQLSITCYAQSSLESVHIASPTASSLGKFVDIPIGYHTGTPNIDIPIYTVKDGPLTIPITLSYHASGLKVMEQASWVGAGWALKGPNAITRSTRGNPDDIAQSDTYYLQDKGYFDYLFYDEQSHPPLLAYWEFGAGRRDGEADIFFFSCGDYSGSFSFRADKTLDVVPQQEVDIKPIFCNAGNCSSTTTNGILSGWIITTPDGVKYYYGKTEVNPSGVIPVEYANIYSTQSGMSYQKEVSSWYLYKIESPDKLNTITLSYAKEDYGFYTISMFTIPDSNYAPGSEDGMHLVKNIVNGVRLSSIQFTGGTVTFGADTNPRQDLCSDSGGLWDYDQAAFTGHDYAKALKQIRVQGTNLDKVFEFNYDYFVDNVNPLRGRFGLGLVNLEAQYNIHSDRKRLKLLSFQERSWDNSVTIPPHVFSYDDESSVPRTLSLAQDHWGYYNGATNNTQLIPYVSVDGGNTFGKGLGAEREAAWPAMRAGALKSIQYPTGGSTDFEFEAHENGYIRHWLTYERAQFPFYDGSVGFGGSSNGTPENVDTLNAGKYFVRKNGSSLEDQNSGTLSLVNVANNNTITYGINVRADVTELVDIPQGIYRINISVGGQVGSGHGASAQIYVATPTWHTAYPLIGGLRIKKMTFRDGASLSPDVVQTFEYKDDNGTSQGVLYSRPYHVFALRNDRIQASGLAAGLVSGGALTGYESPNGCLPPQFPPGYYMSPGSVLPMKTSQGSHIGYNQVKVMQADGGYTIYTYNLGQNEPGDVSAKVINISVCDPLSPNFPPAPQPHNFSRGELRKVRIYDASGNKLKESNFSNEYTPELVGVHGLIVKAYAFSDFLATEYELKSAKKTKSISLVWNYGQTASGAPTGVMTETYFDSPSHTLPTRVVTTEVTARSASETEIVQVTRGKVLSDVRNKYVADIAPCAESNAAETTLLSTMISLEIGYYSSIGTCTDFNCRFAKYLEYLRDINNARKTYVSDRVAAQANYTSCMTDSSVYNAASTELKAIIDLKNRNEIAGLLETSNWRDGLFLSSMLTTYQQFEGNPLYIYPAKTELVRTGTPQPPQYFNALANTSTALVKDSKYQLDATLKFSAGKLVEVTGRNGLVTSYLWKDNLPIAKVIGVSFSTLKDAFTAAGSDLTALRTQPSMINRQLSTYTYDPLVGMTSSTDPNGIKVKYVYDKLGRLDHAKDKDENIVQKMDYRYKQ